LKAGFKQLGLQTLFSIRLCAAQIGFVWNQRLTATA